MSKGARYWIEKLELEPHPEGGFFRETHRSVVTIDHCCTGRTFSGPRSLSTAIYYLLEKEQFSALHRIKSDELWHHYHGSPLSLHSITAEGMYTHQRLGSGPGPLMEPQVLIPAGHWFGATVDGTASFALVGCTVAPGFDFTDFELGRREELLQLFPQHASPIINLTR